MIFGNKDSGQPTGDGSAPPPWENMDKTSTKHVSLSPGFNLTNFVAMVTGFGNFGTKLLLFGLAVALGFLSYVLYMRTEQRPPLPPQVDRPATEIIATTTTPATNASTTLQ